MATLMPEPPELSFDEEELKAWGLIWRIAMKARADRGNESEEGDDEEEGEPGEELEAEGAELLQEGLNLVAEAQGAVEGKAATQESNPPEQASQTPVAGANSLAEQVAALPERWEEIAKGTKKAAAFNKKQGMDFGLVFDRAVGKAIALMLGDIEVEEYKGSARTSSLLPPKPECVEVGPARIIGGVRPQNFDVAYRPDGVRIAYDSKSLNDAKSIQKNWQNMVNDLATEATTVHTRFPYAVVGFIVVLPRPALKPNQEADLIRTLERLAAREHVIDQNHLAEAIALVVWDPDTGTIDPDAPPPDSPLRYEHFMTKVHHCYMDRYKGLPPHDK